MIGIARNDKSPLGSGLDVGGVVGLVSLVAGTGLALCLPISSSSIPLQKFIISQQNQSISRAD
jgi:hypothetical protein